MYGSMAFREMVFAPPSWLNGIIEPEKGIRDERRGKDEIERES